jgi:L-amino acid N-acyltransferase YncA
MDERAIEIREATPADLPRIFAIYNEEIEHGTATFEVEPKRVERDGAWLTERDALYPVLVGTDGEDLVGWASLSQWSPRGAYRRTAEVSEYVDAAHRGRGIGRALLAALVERARERDIAVLLARVTQPNPASEAMHESLGFRAFGTQRRCGEKFGRILDVKLMDLHLDGPGDAISASSIGSRPEAASPPLP